MPLPNRLLATAPFVALGAMAYSLYLWHWPLLIFWLAYTGQQQANFVEGAGVLLVSGVLAWLTTQIRREPAAIPRLGARPPPPRRVTIPLRTRLRRPTMVLGSVVALLGVALTATSFTWREHMTVERATGKELSGLSSRDYPGARALINQRQGAQAADAARPCSRPRRTSPAPPRTAASATSTTSTSSTAPTATRRRPAPSHWPAGHTPSTGSPRWTCWASMHHFKVVTYLKMGCPLTTEEVPLVMGDNRPYPKCHEWNEQVMAKLIADHPDYVFTTSTRPWNIKPGDVMPGTYIGIWQTFSDNNIPILAMRDTPWLVRNGKPFFPADCLADGGNAISCGIKRSEVLSDHNPTLDFVARFPLLKPLDMSDAVCREDICRAVEGNVLMYHDSHHISTTYMRTMTHELGPSDRGPPPAGGDDVRD